MKRLMAAALAAALMLTPVSSQAFFLGDMEDIIDYKMELLDCFGKIFSPEHCASGPVVNPPLKSLSEQSPGAPPKPVVVDECDDYAYLLRELPIGARLRVAEQVCDDD
jgi:hypothetical protein